MILMMFHIIAVNCRASQTGNAIRVVVVVAVVLGGLFIRWLVGRKPDKARLKVCKANEVGCGGCVVGIFWKGEPRAC